MWGGRAWGESFQWLERIIESNVSLFLSSLSGPVPVFWLVEVKLLKEVESWN